MSAQAARADELRAPQNVNARAGDAAVVGAGQRAAIADMKGQPQQARELANQAIRADPRDPWPYYNKGMALAELGETDAALAALYAAEQRFAPTDRWGTSVAIYGRAHALGQAGRCVEAVQAFAEYASFVGKDDPDGRDDGAALRRRTAGRRRARARRAGATAPEADAAGSRARRRRVVDGVTPPSRHCGSGSDAGPGRSAA